MSSFENWPPTAEIGNFTGDFKMVLISVVIPTCHRNELLGECLDCIAPGIQTLGADRYEVIVTDDGSQSTARELILDRFPWARWVEGPRKGPAANRNNGVKYAKGEWLVFTDDDCLPSPPFLASYLTEIEKGVYKALEGATQADRPRERFDEEAPLNLSGGSFWSCNIAIQKAVFVSVSGFDEGFPYPALEDVDFRSRVSEVTTICFVPDAVVVHPWRRYVPFASYKKWLVSHKYFLTKNNTNLNSTFRFRRFKLFIGSSIADAIQLATFSFKGTGFYFEKVWFHFRMIFI